MDQERLAKIIAEFEGSITFWKEHAELYRGWKSKEGQLEKAELRLEANTLALKLIKEKFAGGKTQPRKRAA